jgi:hypothetical protein
MYIKDKWSVKDSKKLEAPPRCQKFRKLNQSDCVLIGLSQKSMRKQINVWNKGGDFSEQNYNNTMIIGNVTQNIL